MAVVPMQDSVITIDALDWDARIQELAQVLGGGASAKPIRKATNRAAKKTTQWLRRQIARIASQHLGIQQKLFADARIKVRIDNGKDALGEAVVWIGTEPMDAHQLGTVRWTRRQRGAKAGRKLFPGSFAHDSEGPIFRRSDEPKRTMRKGRYKGKKRQPIEKEQIEIDPVISENVLRMERRAGERYLALLAQEMNYELSKVVK